MRIVTNCAMLALFSASFVALNNCGNQSGSTSDQVISMEENGPASDFNIVGGLPPVYPISLDLLPYDTIEISCNDGVDNDGNGLTDCEDYNCHVHPECSEFGPPLEDTINSRALTVYPNGLIVPEDVVFLKSRTADDDNDYAFPLVPFFDTSRKDCWVDPWEMDPYYSIPLGEALVAGIEGPIGPQFNPEMAVSYYGPRAGLINDCDFNSDLLFWNVIDDEGDDDSDEHRNDDDDDGNGNGNGGL